MTTIGNDVPGNGFTDDSGTLTLDLDARPPTGHPERFAARWTLAGAGLANVWRYGDLDLDAPTGRLLMRGANGAGKTTALEALCPFLIDLNQRRLAAGKARPTTLALLMGEGSGGKRRTGYAWLTFAAPGQPREDADGTEALTHGTGERSWGVRLQYGPSSTPKVKVIPFAIPGRPLQDMNVYGPGKAALNYEDFAGRVKACGGVVFDSGEEYVNDLASTIWRAGPDQLATLTARIRDVRNPTLLGEVTPNSAADALRASLPTVDSAVLSATADALAESDLTRDAFTRDKNAAKLLAEFATTWTGHVVDVVGEAHSSAVSASEDLDAARKGHDEALEAAETAQHAYETLDEQVSTAENARTKASGAVEALRLSEEYKAVEKLAQLREQAGTARANSVQALGILTSAADRVADASREITGDLTRLATDVDEIAGGLPDSNVLRRLPDNGSFAEGEGAKDASGRVLRWASHPRSAIRVADTIADPGPGISITSTGEDFETQANAWSQLSQALVRHAERAEVSHSDYGRQVKPAYDHADSLAAEANAAEEHAQNTRDTAISAAEAAEEARSELVSAIADWAGRHREADEKPVSSPGGYPFLAEPIDNDEIADIATAEPAQILALADEWADAVTETAARHAAALESTADGQATRATELRAEASEWRQEADRLRSGKLLPLPRPDWASRSAPPPDGTVPAGVGVGATLLGELLTWTDTAPAGPARDSLEVALADSGLLGATLTARGAMSQADEVIWRVDATGPVAASNLTSVLTIDTDYPDRALAETAHDVLRRVTYTTASAVAGHGSGDTNSLVIAADGSFRAGPLTGDRLAGIPDRAAPAASFVGARQRREAALAEADRLERAAAEQEDQATGLEQAAEQQRQTARTIRDLGRTFPDRSPLRRAESQRSYAAGEAAKAATAATKANQMSQQAAQAARSALAAWKDRCRGLGVPADPVELEHIERDFRVHGQQFADAAKAARGRLLNSFNAIAARVEKAEKDHRELAGLRTRAAATHDQAVKLAEQLRVQTELTGVSAPRIVEELAAARQELAEWEKEIPRLSNQRDEALRTATRTSEQAQSAQKTVDRLQPVAEGASAKLRLLVNAPGVKAALLGSRKERAAEPRIYSTPSTEPIEIDQTSMSVTDLLDYIEGLLKGRRPVGRRALDTSYDDVRGKLAGVWSLDHADPVAGLETFILVHNEEDYDPAAAAAKASELAERAEFALAEAEDAALRKFIIGKLPAAIGAAWHELLRWRAEVNAKMKDASASSGVGVQVDIKVSDDLPAAVKAVHQLSVKTSDAERTHEQREEVGAAIRSLIDGAEGDTMLERVSAAVDVRDWVDVSYRVTRPGQEPKRWTPRTGLSGGERRLVVLAPMLAAVAAGYDSMETSGLRIVALDEVPAEVDEAGREGLARYLAELDLDIICTSYLWDGAPGAWDGIDAWDFEVGEDGIVVAFPMLVRGAEGLPGDEAWDEILAAQEVDHSS